METNVELVYKDITITTVNGSATQTWVVRVPFLENEAKLAQGVELIWKCFPKKRKETDKTHVNWIDDYKASQAQAKAESKKAKKDDDDTRSKSGQKRKPDSDTRPLTKEAMQAEEGFGAGGRL